MFFPYIPSEKVLLSQELRTLRLSRNEARSELINQSRELHECQDRIASLEVRLKMYESSNHLYSEYVLPIPNRPINKANSLISLSERTDQCMASARSLLNLNEELIENENSDQQVSFRPMGLNELELTKVGWLVVLGFISRSFCW